MSSNVDVLSEEDDAIIASFEEMAQNAAQVQEALLHHILLANASCQYLYHTCGLHGRTDMPSFKQCVPLVKHSHILPYIQRIMDGDASSPILTAAPITAMSRSSGTSNGQTNFLPFVDSMVPICAYARKLSNAYRNRLYPLRPTSRRLHFVTARKLGVSKGGLKIGPMTAYLNVILKQMYQSDIRNLDVVEICGSLSDIAESPDFRQTIYCQLLRGLIFHEEVEYITASFAYVLVEAFRMLQMEWEQLCEDLRLGDLSKRVTDTNLRASILGNAMTTPNPCLANAVREKCLYLQSQTVEGLESWSGLMPLLWPNCKYVLAIVTGYMEPYLDRLKRYAGKVPIVCGNFSTSEGPVAVNINPESIPPHVSFTLVPNLAYYEFIPYCLRPKPTENMLDEASAHGKARADDDDNESVQQPLDISQLKVGEEYEIVLTTLGGLYRYRLQDVVRVTGFYKACPKFEYVSRANVILSVATDMSTEKDLAQAVSIAAKWLTETSAHAIELIDYTSYVDRATDSGHYVIFWELSWVSKGEGGDVKDSETLQTWLAQCATLLDLSFANGASYLLHRQMGTISALELCIVEEGTFSKMLDSAVRVNEASIDQYKVPRLVISPHARAMLRDFTCSTSYSSATRADFSIDDKVSC